MLPTLSTPVILAHRGASSHAPENTLAAFQLAVEQGAVAIELDVQLTQDNQVVVFHDRFLDRTSDGTGKLNRHTLAEVRKFNAGFPSSPAYQKQTIPTLAEVFESLPQHILLNIELKNLHAVTNDLPAKVLGIIREFNAETRVLVSSFNTIALAKSSQISPTVPLGLLIRTPSFAAFHLRFPILLSKVYSVHLSYRALTTSLISRMKKAGKKVFTYTLNHTTDILNAINMGVDGFFTDDPAFAHRILVQEGHLEKATRDH